MWQSTITCNISTAQCKDGTVKCEEKKWITKYNKSSIKCDVRIAQCEDETFKCEKKKIKEPPNVTKKLSHVILKLYNVRIKSLNVMFWYSDIASCILINTIPKRVR